MKVSELAAALELCSPQSEVEIWNPERLLTAPVQSIQWTPRGTVIIKI